jgi:hypothetical protein
MRIHEILTEAELAEIDRRGFLRGMGAAAAAAAVPGVAQAALQSMTVNGRQVQRCSPEWVREIQDSIEEIKASIQRRQQRIKDPNMSIALRASAQEDIRRMAKQIDERERWLDQCRKAPLAPQPAQTAQTTRPTVQPAATQDRSSRMINRPGDF